MTIPDPDAVAVPVASASEPFAWAVRTPVSAFVFARESRVQATAEIARSKPKALTVVCAILIALDTQGDLIDRSQRTNRAAGTFGPRVRAAARDCTVAGGRRV